VRRFGWPDVFLQPVHQRQVVGQAAHQAHCGVGVQVDQAGDQDVILKGDFLAGLEAVAGLVTREQGNDAAVMHGDCVINQHYVRGDRSNPAGFNQEVDGFGCLCHGKRRLFNGGRVLK
jgi:hypothetical protein